MQRKRQVKCCVNKRDSSDLGFPSPPSPPGRAWEILASSLHSQSCPGGLRESPDLDSRLQASGRDFPHWGAYCVVLSRSAVSDSPRPHGLYHQAPLSMGFSRQEYGSGLPFPSLGDLPNPAIKPGSPALKADSLPLSHQGSPSEKTDLRNCYRRKKVT